MGRRQFTVRTLLVWMVVFALLCGALSAAGAPLDLFIILFSWVAVVWFATLFCPPRLACGVGVGLGAILGAISGLPVVGHQPTIAEVVVGRLICALAFAAFGLGIYAAVELINRLIDWGSHRGEGDTGQDRDGSDR
jgi:hypothetical protein